MGDELAPARGWLHSSFTQDKLCERENWKCVAKWDWRNKALNWLMASELERENNNSNSFAIQKTLFYHDVLDVPESTMTQSLLLRSQIHLVWKRTMNYLVLFIIQIMKSFSHWNFCIPYFRIEGWIRQRAFFEWHTIEEEL